MNRSERLNGGAYCRTAFQAINKTATAAGSGDNTEVDCDWIDRDDAVNGLAMSGKLVITYTCSIDTAQTLSFKSNFQDATTLTGTGVADYGDLTALTAVADGGSGGDTVKGTVEIDVDFSGANQFVRSQITPDLSAAGVDTCEWSACLLLFGSNRQPSTDAIDTVGGPA